MRYMHLSVVVLGRSVHGLEDLDLRVGNRVRKVIRVHAFHVRAAFGDIELMNVVLLALMEIDRFLMQRGECAGIVHFSDDPGLLCRFHDDEIIRADASQRDRICRIRIAGPVPLIVCTMNETPIAQVFQYLRYIVTAKSLVGSERQLKRGALKMVNQNVNIIGIDKSQFRRLAQKIVRMIDNELIERRTRCHQYRYRYSAATAGSSHALPGGGDCSRIAGENGYVQATEIVTQLQ